MITAPSCEFPHDPRSTTSSSPTATPRSTSEREGTSLERLACAFLTADPVQAEEYSQVWTWGDWAAVHGRSGKDVGVDLVRQAAQMKTATRPSSCKFYGGPTPDTEGGYRSFISASGKAPFVRRVVIDTTEVPWGRQCGGE